MMELYEVFLHDDAIVSLSRTRGRSRREIKRFLNDIGNNPFSSEEHSYEDRKGRTIRKIRIEKYMVDYIIDHPMNEVKIVEINRVRE